MKTESEINRNESFYTQINKFAQRRSTVYNLIKTYKGLTSHEIKDKMVLGKHQISGRVTELAEEFWIKPVWSKLNEKTNKMNTVWVVTDPEDRERLVENKMFDLVAELSALIADRESYFLSDYCEDLIESRIKKLTKLINKLS